MDAWWRSLGAVSAGAGLVLGVVGCSNLVVKKVPVEKRIEGRDHHVKGFRYYLNRPYFAVTERVLVATRKTLVWVEFDEQGLNPKLLIPAHHGQVARTVRLSDLKVAGNETGAVRAVTPAELERLKRAVVARRDEQLAKTQLAPGEPAVPPPPAPPLQQAVAPAGSPPNAVTLPEGAMVQVPPGTRLELPANANVQITPPPPLVVPAPVPAEAELGAGAMLPGAAALQAAPMGAMAETPDTTQYPLLTPTTAPAPAPLATGPIQVVFLPDFDEQYVIKSKNMLAKSAFSLAFAADSTLSEVQGEHDATTLTISLLQQVQGAIDAAKGIFGAPASPASSSSSVTSAKTAATKAAGAKEALPRKPTAAYFLVETCYIRPGLYRLNKPWEMTGPDAFPPGAGLLTKLGLPVAIDIDLVPVTPTP